MPGIDAPTDSADAAERRQAGRDGASLVLPLPPIPRRSRRGEADAAAVLDGRRALVDAHPLGEAARSAARDLVWPYRADLPGTAKAIEVEDLAVELLADPAWVTQHATDPKEAS